MTTYTVTSNDTLTLNGNVFTDLALDDVTSITFPNDLVTQKTGKNGNTIIAQNAPGQNANMTLRVMRGSDDDQFLQNILTASLGDFPSTPLINGSFVKKLGDGAGNIKRDTYQLAGGTISKIPDGKENVSGDVTQGEAIYLIKFPSATRIIK